MSDSNGGSSSGVSLLKGILPIKRGAAIRDVLAGISLAFMDIPQVLGYARIAGMPAVTGLYTVFLPLVAFAIFGASRHLVVAADSATATIFASRVSAMAPLGSAEYVTLAAMVALLTAAMLLLARIFRLGFLADFLSRTVLVGFLAGVGVQLSIAMLGDMLGMAVPAPSSRSVAQLEYVVTHLARTHLPTLALAALVAGAILGCKRVLPRVPMPMIAVAGSIAASRAFDFSAHGVAVLGPVAGGLPALRFPAVTWQQLLDLVPVAASCFVMIIAQSAAAARVFAQQYREAVDTDADILGLAAANAAAAFSGTFVVNGSPTQTAMADGAGTRSQVGQLAFAVVVVVVLLFLSPLLQYLPHGVLAAIVFTIALGLINVQSLRAIRRESPGEFTLALVTAAAVVMIGVEQGILLAVALSLMRHVRHSYRPHTMVLEPAAGGRRRAVAARAGPAGRDDGAGADRLPLRVGPVLCERSPVCRGSRRARRRGAGRAALVHHRCGGDHRCRLFGGAHGERSGPEPARARDRRDLRPGKPLSARGHGAARDRGDRRRVMHLRDAARGARGRGRAAGSARAGERVAARRRLTPDIRRRS